MLKKISMLVVVIMVLISFTACSKPMGDTQYEVITSEIADEMIEYLFNSEFADDDEVLDERLFVIIGEVAAKYDYTTKQYLNKMEKQGDDLEMIWLAIDNKLQELLEYFYGGEEFEVPEEDIEL